MTLTIELPEKLAAAIEAKARKQGVSPDSFVAQVLEDSLTDQGTETTRTGADLIASLQASPFREIEIEPERYPMPVRNLPL